MNAIGAGFGRTGTESLRKALDILGMGPTHHMFEVIEQPLQKERWRTVANGGERDWDILLEGYNSAVDWPAAYFWHELMDVFPEAKIILTVRDCASWWQSFEATILMAIEKTSDPNAINRRIIAEGAFGGRFADREHAIEVYRAHNALVRETVPKERLIELELGGGWPTLCRGFGIDEPVVPYPSGNEAGTFTADGTET